MWATYGPSGPVKLQSKLPPTFASTPSGHAEAQSRALAPRAQLRTGGRLRMSSARLSDEHPVGGPAAEGHAAHRRRPERFFLWRRGAGRGPLARRCWPAGREPALLRCSPEPVGIFVVESPLMRGLRPEGGGWGRVLAAQLLEEISQPAASARG